LNDILDSHHATGQAAPGRFVQGTPTGFTYSKDE